MTGATSTLPLFGGLPDAVLRRVYTMRYADTAHELTFEHGRTQADAPTLDGQRIAQIVMRRDPIDLDPCAPPGVFGLSKARWWLVLESGRRVEVEDVRVVDHVDGYDIDDDEQARTIRTRLADALRRLADYLDTGEPIR